MRLLLLLLLARNLLSDDLMAGAGRNWILRDSDTRAPVSEWAGQCSSESERRDRLDPAVRNSDRNGGRLAIKKPPDDLSGCAMRKVNGFYSVTLSMETTI